MTQEKRIHLMHGSGGRATMQLLEDIFFPAFDNPWLAQKNDQACFKVDKGRLAISTDAHVVSPLFFPGGDIGMLSVNGTINDVAMAGARPLYLTASFVLEEGLLIRDLKRVVQSMADAAKQAQVAVISGDLKVVEKGKCDGMYITTTGVGVVPEGLSLSGDQAKPGDCVILSGSIGDHGIAIMSARQHMQFYTDLKSDTAALHDLVASMIKAAPHLRCLRDPTRGGVGAILNEWAHQSHVGFIIEEESIPICSAVQSACELFGLDPLYIANEGKLMAICPPEETPMLLIAMQSHPLGRQSVVIGHVIHSATPSPLVQMRTRSGGMRLVDWLQGDKLPRIC
jgi:hydrogenase expression/formation protein HypE